MERLRKIEKKSEEKFILLPVNVLEKIVQEDEFNNLATLYLFYQILAVQQNSKKIIITNESVSKQLHWNKDKVSRIRGLLIKLGVMENFCKRGSDGKVYHHGVKFHDPLKEGNQDPRDEGFHNIYIFPYGNNNIIFFNKEKENYSNFLKRKFPSSTKDTEDDNSSKKESSNRSSSIFDEQELESSPSNKITPRMFDKFWEVYPKKLKYGYAKECWDKLCRLPNSDPLKPTLSEILSSIEALKKSKQWKNKTLIPHPSTFLNGQRWKDDVEEMDRVYEFYHQKDIEKEMLEEETKREQEMERLREQREIEERIKRYNKKYDDPNLY